MSLAASAPVNGPTTPGASPPSEEARGEKQPALLWTNAAAWLAYHYA